MPEGSPKVDRAIKPEFIDLSLRVQVDKDGNYTIFGQPSFICPEHSNDIRSIQECFLDSLVSLIKNYAFMPDEKLSDGAQELKKRIFNAVWITYPSPPEPASKNQCHSYNHYLGVRCELESGHHGRHRSKSDELSWKNRSKTAYLKTVRE